MMKSSGSIAKVEFLSIFLVTLSFAFGACFVAYHPLLTIQVQNQTDETLKIFLDGETFVGDALPGGELMFETPGNLPGYRITAKDMGGNRVFSVVFTREDVKQRSTKDAKGRRTYQVIIPPEGKGVGNTDNVTGK